jgi:hypothetical protein
MRSLMSAAMIRRAFTSRAPRTTLSPTPPTPNTATVLPGRTRAVLITAPTPVITPQPTRAATARGTSPGIGITAFSWTTVYPWKHDVVRKWWRPVLGEAQRPVGHGPGGAGPGRVLAERGPADGAGGTAPARRPPHQDHAIAGPDRRDALAGALDDTGSLVPQHDGQGDRPLAADGPAPRSGTRPR